MLSWSKVEYRMILRYNFARGLSIDQCFEEMVPVLGEDCPHRSTISRWYREFKRGNFQLEDAPRSGRPASAVTEENINAVRKLLEEDGGVTYRQIMKSLGLNAPAIRSILRDHLHVKKKEENQSQTRLPVEDLHLQELLKVLAEHLQEPLKMLAEHHQERLKMLTEHLQEPLKMLAEPTILKVSKVSIPVKVLNNATYCKEEENYDISQSTDIKIKVEPTLTDDVYQDSVVSEEKAKDFLVDCSRIKEEANPDSGNEEEHLDSMIDISETTFIKQEDRCYIGVEIKMEENCTGVGVKIKMEESCTGVNIKREKSSTGVKIKREECYTGVKIKKKKIEPDLYSEDDVS
ncbi:unnamed protein product [Nezara viridula]|uniref:Mos1 transposase HTH domain-containing protein n=1 Tax=Nezara viridula TaxID=85310 RepID=A0A9P0HTU8_NEZVI|nr:unnamed protein product [Nezara viridula]